jgi:hypothetical protein
MPAVHHGAFLPLWILASPKDRMAKPVSSDQIDLAFGAILTFAAPNSARSFSAD